MLFLAGCWLAGWLFLAYEAPLLQWTRRRASRHTTTAALLRHVLPHPLLPQVCYVILYQGRDRGVLVQLGTQQLGHFPLGMHDEAMSKPPPQLPPL